MPTSRAVRPELVECTLKISLAMKSALLDQLDSFRGTPPLEHVSLARERDQVGLVHRPSFVVSTDKLHRDQVPDPGDPHLVAEHDQRLRCTDDLALDPRRSEQEVYKRGGRCLAETRGRDDTGLQALQDRFWAEAPHRQVVDEGFRIRVVSDSRGEIQIGCESGHRTSGDGEAAHDGEAARITRGGQEITKTTCED